MRSGPCATRSAPRGRALTPFKQRLEPPVSAGGHRGRGASRDSPAAGLHASRSPGPRGAPRPRCRRAAASGVRPVVVRSASSGRRARVSCKRCLDEWQSSPVVGEVERGSWQGLLSIERRTRSALVTLHAPGEAQRALDRAAPGARRGFPRLSGDEGVGCVVLTGAGPAFCSGMDTGQFGGDLEHRRALVETSTLAFEAVGDCQPADRRRRQRPGDRRRLRALAALRPAHRIALGASSDIPSCRAASRRATRRRARCCRRPSRRSSASPAAW